ncbi:MAG: hypothetical protein JWO03_1179 [Bacteroidetes bacterium]|nr:hypothetical protein [Bacteroidota bacterium]
MGRCIWLFSLLFLYTACDGQSAGMQYDLLMNAYQHKDMVLLRKICKDLSAENKTQPAFPNDTVRCIYNVAKNVLPKLYPDSHGSDSDKYLIFPTQLEYGVVEELDPDSVIIHSLLKSQDKETHDSFSLIKKHASDSAFNRSIQIYIRAKSACNQNYAPYNTIRRPQSLYPDMFMEVFYDIKRPKSDTLRDFQPTNGGRFIFQNDSMVSILTHFLACDTPERKKRRKFLEKVISLPKLEAYLPLQKYPQKENLRYAFKYQDKTVLLDSFRFSFSSPYIEKIVLDRHLNFAMVYYADFFPLSEMLFRRNKDHWDLVNVLTINYESISIETNHN